MRLVASLHMLHEPSYHTTHIYLLYHFFVGFLQVPHILELGIVKGQLKGRARRHDATRDAGCTLA